MSDTPFVPMVWQDDDVEIFTRNLDCASGSTFIFRHRPTNSLVLIDFGIGFSARMKNKSVESEVQPYADFLAQLPRNTDDVNILLSHCHFDHTTGVPYLAQYMPVRVWTAPFTAHVLNRNSEEEFSYDLQILEQPTGEIQIGAFRVLYGPAVHSTPQTRFFILEYPRADLPEETRRILFMSEFRITESSLTPGLSEQMLQMVSENGPYHLAFLDGLRADQPGLTQPEDCIYKPLQQIVPSLPGDILFPFLSSKVAFMHVLAKIAAETGCGLDIRGGSMRRVYRDALDLGWLPSVEFDKKDKNVRMLLGVTGSQDEPGSFLNKIAEQQRLYKRLQKDKLFLRQVMMTHETHETPEIFLQRMLKQLRPKTLLRTDSIFCGQGAIPMYTRQVRNMYQHLSELIPDGFIIMPRCEQRRLKLEVPNLMLIEDVVDVGDDFELSSGHGKAEDIKIMLAAITAKGEPIMIFLYQRVNKGKKPEDMIEEAGFAEVGPFNQDSDSSYSLEGIAQSAE